MKYPRLFTLNVMALCCALGLLTKKNDQSFCKCDHRSATHPRRCQHRILHPVSGHRRGAGTDAPQQCDDGNGAGSSGPCELKDLLESEKIDSYSNVTVISDDSYHAELTAEEVAEEGRAYLMLQDEELRLIVFGDSNSKRSVSNVVQIVIE